VPLDSGALLGPYEIISPLGAGGMGEVYRARDTRLAREVAVKVLPPDFASDTSRRQRFEQEARTIAALNHPNIVAIHDVGDGYIVTELIDGESLRGMKFGVRKVVDIGAQIASGLAAAHDAGIVHRDLKPDNILLTRDGRVKILDFGLAQVRAARAAAEGTQTMTVHTEPGVVMGTVGYMSPEQVRGAATDHRTDIFCLGLILHELLTGTRVFHRDTSVETMTAILKQDAPELPESIPASLRQIIARCLEKEPASRFQSARDLGFALSQSTTHTSGRAAAIPKPRNLRWPLIALAAALAGVAAGAILFRAPAPPIWSGVMLGGPEMALGPRLAPDGHLLAFLAMMDGVTQLALMKPETGNWNVLTHDRSRGPANFVKWSADGSLIYYDRYADVPEGIFTIPVVGGEEHQVIANACCPEPLPDGSLLMLRLNSQHQLQLFRFWADTGRMRDYPVLVRSDFQGETIEVTPHAREAVLVGAPLGGSPDDRRMLAVDLASATVRTLDVRLLVQSIPGYWTLSADGKSVLSLSPSGSLNHILSTPLAGGPSRSLFTTTEDVRSLNAGVDCYRMAGWL
jgi:eukaryotic-like serine/threonine-protein kinase